MTPNSEFLTAIKQQLGPDRFTQSEDAKNKYGQDWSGLLTPKPLGVAFPTSTDEVAALLALCNKHGVKVVPSGGRTGLSGGAVAAFGELVLSLERMNKMGSVDTLGLTLWVQAGAITQAVHEHCEAQGLTWPVDFASKGSSHIGGNISTNAGGVHVIHYGSTRNWVLGLKVVLMSGEVLDLLSPLEKNNTGLDLKQLFIGSEGTLGIVTEAVLKLTPVVSDKRVAIFSLKDFSSVLELYKSVRLDSSVPILAFECLSDLCFNEVLRHLGRPSPLTTPGEYYVLIEIAAHQKNNHSIDLWLEGLFEKSMALDGMMAQSSSEAQFLWKLREDVAESIMVGREVHQQDVSVPIHALEPFAQEVVAKYQKSYPDFEVFIFGHIGDGNLHVFIRKPLAMEKDLFLKKCKASDGELFKIIHQFRGSVSAEHGVGLLKKDAIQYTRSKNELRIMGQLKATFDTLGLLNPGKVI